MKASSQPTGCPMSIIQLRFSRCLSKTPVAKGGYKKKVRCGTEQAFALQVGLVYFGVTDNQRVSCPTQQIDIKDEGKRCPNIVRWSGGGRHNTGV